MRENEDNLSFFGADFVEGARDFWVKQEKFTELGVLSSKEGGLSWSLKEKDLGLVMNPCNVEECTVGRAA